MKVAILASVILATSLFSTRSNPAFCVPEHPKSFSAMEADLSRPPPASSSSTCRPPQPSRRPTSAQTYTGTQLEQSRGKRWDKWKEWDELATDLGCDWVVEADMEAFGKVSPRPAQSSRGGALHGLNVGSARKRRTEL